jgi:hypothetical protein
MLSQRWWRGRSRAEASVCASEVAVIVGAPFGVVTRGRLHLGGVG